MNHRMMIFQQNSFFARALMNKYKVYIETPPLHGTFYAPASQPRYKSTIISSADVGGVLIDSHLV